MKGLNDSRTDELLTLLEKLQNENETQQIQIREARQTLSQLSSQNSILRNELLKKSGMIVSLNEKIETLSESDLVLKRNELLERQIMESRKSVQSARREAEIAVSTAEKKAESAIREVRREYAQRQKTLKGLEVELGERESAVYAREQALHEEIERRSAEIVKDKLTRLDVNYRRLRRGYSAFVFFTLLFGVAMTCITACRTEVLMQDFESFFHVIGLLLQRIWIRIDGLATTVSKLGLYIPQKHFARAVQGILWAGIVILFTGAIEMTLLVSIGKIVKHAKRRQTDEISIFVILIDMSFTFAFAEEIKAACKINLLLFMLLVFVFYRVILVALMKKIADDIMIKHSTIG